MFDHCKLRMRKNREARRWAREIERARRRGGEDLAWQAECARSEAIQGIEEKIDALLTRKLVARAERARIPVPHRPRPQFEKGEDGQLRRPEFPRGNKHWRWARHVQEWVLSPEALTALRKEVEAYDRRRLPYIVTAVAVAAVLVTLITWLLSR